MVRLVLIGLLDHQHLTREAGAGPAAMFRPIVPFLLKASVPDLNNSFPLLSWISGRVAESGGLLTRWGADAPPKVRILPDPPTPRRRLNGKTLGAPVVLDCWILGMRVRLPPARSEQFSPTSTTA